MVIAEFWMEDKACRPRFFQETFLVTDTKFEVIIRMLFLKISNANISFDEETLIRRFYTTNKTLPSTKQVQMIN